MGNYHHSRGFCQGQGASCNGYRRLEDGETVSAPAATPDTAFVTTPAPSAAQTPIMESLFPKTRQLVATCAEGISQVNTALNTLATQVSPPCRSVLLSEREVTCLTEIDVCEIQKIRLLNAYTDAVIVDSFTSGMSFCSCGPRITFEAINDRCVCNVQGQAVHSRFEFYRPIVLFSNSLPNAQGVVDLYGRNLAAATYSLEYYPDSTLGATVKLSFKVKPC